MVTGSVLLPAPAVVGDRLVEAAVARVEEARVDRIRPTIRLEEAVTATNTHTQSL